MAAAVAGIIVPWLFLRLGGGPAHATEEPEGSWLLEQQLSGASAWCGGGGVLLRKDSGGCCRGSAVEEGGSGRLFGGGLVSSPDPALKGLGEQVQEGLRLRPISLIDPDPVLRSWWLLRLINAFRQGASSAPRFVVASGAPLLWRRRRAWALGGRDEDGDLQGLFCDFCFVRGFCVDGGRQCHRLYPSRMFVLVSVLVLFPCSYKYK